MSSRVAARTRASLLAASAFALVGTVAPLATTTGAQAAAPPAKPKKVVVIVVDALRKDLVSTYGMTNIQALERDGADFPNSWLGHMGSETVVTHNVLTSGMLPQHMGWTDEGYRDLDGLLARDPNDPTNDFYLPGDLSQDQLYALQDHAGYPKLQDYLHTAFPGKKVATISPKRYAAYAFGGRTSDITVTFGSSTTCTNPVTGAAEGFRAPGGTNVPSYISASCGRYYVHSSRSLTYDTDNQPARLYPLDGDRYTVGHDKAHEGGDVWAADAAIDIMTNEDWSGVFVTLPGVDKAAHMWGGVDDPGAGKLANGDPSTHLEAAAHVADEQVGRIVRHLRESGQLKDTLVVVTADHGQLPGRTFLGDTADRPGGFAADPRSSYNWYYADTPVFDYLDASAWVKPLVDAGNIGISFQDSAIRLWLKDNALDKRVAAASLVAQRPGVLASYYRDGDHFQLLSALPKKQLTAQEYSWWSRRGQQIVDSSAAPYGADVIGLLRDNTTAGAAGDHGGAQYDAQNIPIVFYGAGTTATDSTAAMRAVDVMPTILKAMGIKPTAAMDGRALVLPTTR